MEGGKQLKPEGLLLLYYVEQAEFTESRKGPGATQGRFIVHYLCIKSRSTINAVIQFITIYFSEITRVMKFFLEHFFFCNTITNTYLRKMHGCSNFAWSL